MHRSGRRLLVGAAFVFAVLLAAGASLGTGQQPAAAASNTVTIQGFAFSPASLTINVGDTVTWVNKDAGVQHSATSDTGVTPAFDTNAFSGAADGSATSSAITFNTAGTFAYHCKIHPSMHGTIVVQAQGTATTTATATTTTTTTTTATATATATTTATATATATTPAPTSTPTQTATPVPTTPAPVNAPCNLTVADQNVSGSLKELLIGKAQQARAGYVAIHESSATGSPGAVIGSSGYLAAGSVNSNLKVTLTRALKDGEKVWAMLHTEDNGNQTYDGAAVDKPTIDASCGNSAVANIVTFPLTVKVAAVPGAPATGSGSTDNGSSTPLMIIVGATLAVFAAAGGTVVIAARKRS